MTNDDAARKSEIQFKSWRRAMATTPPTTPSREDMQTWDSMQVKVYYDEGGREP